MGKLDREGALNLIKEEMERRSIIMPLGMSDLREDLQVREIWDSVDHIEMIYGMENALAFTADDVEWGKADTIGKFIDVLIRHSED